MKLHLIVTAITLASSQVFAMDSLSQFDWKNRVVVLFGTEDDASLVQQIEILNAKTAELADRDMVVLHVSDGEVRPLYGTAGVVDARKLRSDSGVSGDVFRVILVGKDGGVKLRSDTVVSDVELFNLVDRMPMRRAGQK